MPALIATLSCTGILCALYLALYLRHRQGHLGLWSACWAAQSLNLAAIYLQVTGTWPSLPFTVLHHLFALASAWLLWRGMDLFLERPHQWLWSAACLLTAIFIPLADWLLAAAWETSVLVYMFMGVLLAQSGWRLLRFPEGSAAINLTVGCFVILWGLQRASYPWAREVVWWATLGFAFAAVLNLSVALGLLLAFFERLRRELLQAQGAAQANLDLLRTILETAPLGIGLGQPRRILWVNRAFKDYLGHDPHQWLGRETESLYPSREEFERVGAVIYPQLARTGQASVETWLRKADGSSLPVHMRLQMVDRQNEEAGIIVTVGDITERKEAEEEILRSQRVLRAVDACRRALLHAEDEDSLMREICRIVCEEGGYRLAWVGMLEPGGSKVRPVAQWGHEEGYLETAAVSTDEDDPRGRGPLGTALRSGQACVFQDALNDPLFEPWRSQAAKRGYAAVAGLPLLQDRQAFGVLGIYSSQAFAFDQRELDLLMGLARDLAFGLQNLRGQIARREAELRLAQSESLLRAVIDSSPDFIFVKDTQRRTILANRAFAQAVGKHPQEMLGRSDLENGWSRETVFGDPERGIAGFCAHDLAALAGQRAHNPAEPANVGGHIRLFDTLRVPLRDQAGNIYGLLGLARDITERRQAEERLRESEEKFSLAFHHAPVLMAITRIEDGTYLDVNDAFLKAAGYQREEVLGRTSVEIGWLRPADRARIIETLESQGRVEGLEVTSYNRQGRPVACVYHCQKLSLGGVIRLLAIAVDESGRRQAEERLRQSEDRYRLISDNTQEVVCLHDTQMRVIYVSPSVAKVLGYQSTEVMGLSILDMLHPDDAAGVISLLQQRMGEGGQEPMKHENRIRKKDGGYLWMETLASPVLDDKGGLAHFQTSSRDISERKHAEEALLQLAAGVAHNFNNVLMAISGNAQAAQERLSRPRPDVQELARLLENVVQGAQGGTDVVQRLSRYVGGRRVGASQGELVELGELLRSLKQMLEGTWPQFASGRLRLEMEAPEALTVLGVRGELMEVLFNLAKNAVESMPMGGCLSIRAWAEERHALIEVRDNGLGMDPAVLARLFEPFFSTKGVSGQGLGLAVSKGIVASHGGTLSVSSHPGQGSVFTISLPQMYTLPPLPPRVQAQARRNPLRILLVEDESLVAMGLVAILEGAGHQVRHALSLASALEAVPELRPQAVLCDLGLADAEGWQVVEALKEALAQAGLPQTAVVAISGWSSQQLPAPLSEDALQTTLLQKPVEASHLLTLLARLVGDGGQG